MQVTIPTNEEIRIAIREEITTFFSNFNFQQKNDEDDFLNIEAASALIGKAVPTIYDLVNKRLIPHYKRGKQLYFSKRELLDWLKAGKRKTQSELALEAETFNPKIRRKSIIPR